MKANDNSRHRLTSSRFCHDYVAPFQACHDLLPFLVLILF